MTKLLTCCKRSKTHTSVWPQIERLCCKYNGRYCRQLIATCNVYRLFWRISLKFKSFNIASHQKSEELCLHCQHFLMETTPRLHSPDSTLCKCPLSYCPILHPSIHPNTCGTNPPIQRTTRDPEGVDRLRSKSQKSSSHIWAFCQWMRLCLRRNEIHISHLASLMSSLIRSRWADKLCSALTLCVLGTEFGGVRC